MVAGLGAADADAAGLETALPAVHPVIVEGVNNATAAKPAQRRLEIGITSPAAPLDPTAPARPQRRSAPEIRSRLVARLP
jgi:hypothetical protein